MPAASLAIVLLAPALLGQTTLSPFRQLTLTDRALQANGVEMLVSDCDGCTPHLLGMWRTTDRFDVRAHIALVLERLGPEGLPALIELTRNLNTVTDDGQRNLIIRALAPSGPAAVDALMAEIEASPDKHSIVLLLPLVTELGIDPTPYARRLLESQIPEVRAKAITLLSPRLPIVERSRLLIVCANDIDPTIRHSGAAFAVLPVWTDADRAAFPADFTIYIAGLADLLRSNDDLVVRGAATAIRLNGTLAEPAMPLLESVFRENTGSDWARVEAMRAYIAVHPDRAAAIRGIAIRIDARPLEVCTALTDVAPDEIPESLITKLVGVLKPARSREETWAADLLVRIGPRAVPPLIAALPSPDADLSAFAAEALGRIGPPAAAAVDPLIAQLKSRGTGWQGELYARALIAIDLDSPKVRSALTAIVRRASDDPMDIYVSGIALHTLVREHGASLWVRGLAEPVLNDPTHPLHEWVVAATPTEIEESQPPPAPPEDASALIDLIMFGEGDTPSAAMAALGNTRPITPEILELIRAHLDDPRSSMRTAAIAAAGNASEAASPLLDELLERGQTALASGRGYDFAEALQRIAPTDPRVIAFLDAERKERQSPRKAFPY